MKKCRACFSTDLKPFVDLGPQPASNDLQKPGSMQYIFDLAVLVCNECGLGQTSVDLPPDYVFPKDYAYYSSQSPSWVQDRKQLADRMINEFKLDKASLVVDIGSNDGYYLRHFVERGVGVLGYEPAADVADAARAIGVPTHTEFWSRSTHANYADLVNATNVLAHTPDLDSFVEGVSHSLLPDGVATLEFPLFSNLIKYNQLDTIYHEHYSYLSLHALGRVLARHGLRVWRVETVATHGGSVRVFACKEKARYYTEASVAEVHGREVWAPGEDFETKARKVKWDLLKFIASNRHARFVGYGAPAKATVLCNYVGLNKDVIEYTVDDSPYKQGKFVPGTNIPIVGSNDLAFGTTDPNFILLFPWNLMEPIKAKIQKMNLKGPVHLVTAIPELFITEI